MRLNLFEDQIWIYKEHDYRGKDCEVDKELWEYYRETLGNLYDIIDKLDKIYQKEGVN